MLTLTMLPLLLCWNLLTISSLQLFLLAAPSLPRLLPSLPLPAVSYPPASLFLLAASSLPPSRLMPAASCSSQSQSLPAASSSPPLQPLPMASPSLAPSQPPLVLAPPSPPSLCLLAVPFSPCLQISLAASLPLPLSLPLGAAASLSQLAHTLSLSFTLVATLSPPVLPPPLATPVLRLQLPLLVVFPLSPPLPMLATMSSLPTSMATLSPSLACAPSPPAPLSAYLLPSDGLGHYTYGIDFMFLVAPPSTMNPESKLANTGFEDALSSRCGHGIPLPPDSRTQRGCFIFSGPWHDDASLLSLGREGLHPAAPFASLLCPDQEGLYLTFTSSGLLPTHGPAIESPAPPIYSHSQLASSCDSPRLTSTIRNATSFTALCPTNRSSSCMPEVTFAAITFTVLAFVNTFDCFKPILWGRCALRVHELATRYSYSLPFYPGMGITLVLWSAWLSRFALDPAAHFRRKYLD